jgi:hypothetical protein
MFVGTVCAKCLLSLKLQKCGAPSRDEVFADDDKGKNIYVNSKSKSKEYQH